MTFNDALALVFNSNARITRRAWNDRRAYLTLDHRRQLCTSWNSETRSVDALLHPLIITEEDYFADDWEIVE